MIGRDHESAELERWRELAAWLGAELSRRILSAAVRVLAREPLPPGAPVVAAGVGRFLAPALARALDRDLLEFGALVPAVPGEADRASDCAPAVAVGWLAAGRPDGLSRPAGAGRPRER